MKIKYYILFLFAAYLFTVACGDSIEPKDVLLSATPQSVVRGTSSVVHITSSEDIFDKTGIQDLVSDGGLVLRGFHRESKTSAIAEVLADEATAIGRHVFNIEMGSGTGTVTISVLSGPLNQGQVFPANAEASSGADWATLYLDGMGTAWDSGVQVSAEGAPGMHVLAWRVVTESRLEVSYSIDLSQEPVIADIVVQDGAAQWIVPFTIVAAQRFENLAGPQPIIKGRVATATLRNPSSGINAWTRLFTDDDALELGEAEELSTGSVELPVRIPIDFEGDSLSLLAKTFTADRRYVEVMPVELVVYESGAVVF
jgi:hypothetical protein